MYKLKIPYKSKPNSKLQIIGTAIYIINKKGKVIQEWAELKEGTYFKGKNKKYGKRFNKDVIDFREKIILGSSNNFLLGSNDLEKINLFFRKNLTTFLNHDKYTTGSNPAGSDYDLRKTPYLIDGGNYNQLMFANFFKSLREKNSKKIDVNLRKKEVEKVDLEKYFSIFPHIKKIFLEKNKPLFLALNSEKETETIKIDTSNESKDFIKLILDDSYLKNEQISENKKNEKRISILRRIFKNRMRKFEETDQIFGKLSESMCEAAHIFPVYKIRKLDIKKWEMIADNNNGLNLPIQIHKMYDKNFIHFNNNGDIIFNNLEYKKQLSEIFCFKKLKITTKNFDKKRKYINLYNTKI